MKLRLILPLVFSFAFSAVASTEKASTVDVSSLAGKVVCGYQGWFRTENDGAGNGWHHYGADKGFAPGSAHIEMWPDVSELPAADRFPTEFRHADGRTAEVFSSHREGTVRKHFEWMRDYGIDGAFVQRFAVGTRDRRSREPMNRILGWCRDSAKATGRGWTLMYDLSGLRPGRVKSAVMDDLAALRADGLLRPPAEDASRFLHKGKPLVALWGLGFNDREPMLDEWEALIRFLKNDPENGGCAVMLGVPYHWRTLDGDAIKDPKLHELIRLADIVSPWAVGRLATPDDAAGRVERRLKPDVAWCRENGLDYLPVAFPGFSWTNLSKSRGQEAKFDAIPRLGGRFLWSQALAAKSAGASMLYVAMFDELDEGTAIFKTTNDPPVGASRFLTEPGLASDHYLWLTGELGRLFRGEIPGSADVPVR